jgi:hypothetical protein
VRLPPADAVCAWCKSRGYPAPVPEYPFARGIGRKWRFDLAWPDLPRPVAMEFEGGVYSRGRHVRPAGFAGDVEKYNEAAILGWVLVRATYKQVASGEAFNWLERALA